MKLFVHCSILKCIVSEPDWRQQKVQQPSNTSSIGSTTRIRASVRSNGQDNNSAPLDCVASRTRSRTPQISVNSFQGTTSAFDASLASSFNSRKNTTSHTNFAPSTSSSSSHTSHPSTSRGRGQSIYQFLPFQISHPIKF